MLRHIICDLYLIGIRRSLPGRTVVKQHLFPEVHQLSIKIFFHVTDTHDLSIMAENKYAADYAKRVAGCKKCKAKIGKGELRLAKVVANFFSDGEGDMKQYYHAHCLFETFIRARATTRIIEEADDIQGLSDLQQEDKDKLNQLIKETLDKKGSPKKTTPAKPRVQSKLPHASPKTPKNDRADSGAGPSSARKKGANNDHDDDDAKPSTSGAADPAAEKDNAFKQFRRVCADIAEVPGYNDKTSRVAKFLDKGTSGVTGGYKGDLYLMLKLLLPGVVKVVYNLNSKQLVKVFSQIFGTSLEEMVEDLEQGDVAETVRAFFEKSSICPPDKKSTLSIQQVDAYLMELSGMTKEDDQMRVLKKLARRSTGNDLKMIVRLIKHDLRINAGAKHILDALDPNAYEAFKASRNLRDVVDKVLALGDDKNSKPGMKKKLSIRASVMTPISPMLAEACKSVDFAFKRCPKGMFSEIKYDGERVQVHKQGDTFQYFSRSLKPVQNHKVQHFKEYIPKAFPHGNDIILDSEVLLIDTKTGNPLPFGSLGVHKKEAFHDANVCLFVFDCIHYNGENLMTRPIKERRKFLLENMVEVKNRIQFSEMKYITQRSDLKEMMIKVFREGLEGLVLKDVNGQYEPGKRHWLKVKKDYLAEGAMADTADLVVLGAYYGTGNKGGMMSIFLMGTYDPMLNKWCTVTKCGIGFDDKTLDGLQSDFDMVKISKDYSKIPPWLNVNKSLVPDLVIKDPKKSKVWEITGAEFSKSDAHTAGGISIRFPRCTKMRDDKSWKEATNLPRLKELYEKSKAYSDIPDLIGGGGGSSTSSTPSKKTSSAELFGEESDEDIDMKADINHKNGLKATPQKRSADDMDTSESPVTKKLKKSPCKYGAECYQKSADHRANFYHPDKTPTKRVSKHLPNVFTGMKFYIPEDMSKREKLERYIIAFDGEVTGEFDKSTATHIVTSSATDSDLSEKQVTSDWLWRCIKKKKLIPTEIK